MSGRMLVAMLVLSFGCTSGYDRPTVRLPYALSTAGDGVVHIGRRVPGGRPGEVVPFVNLESPEGVTRAWVEVDEDGSAGSFELWYEPDRAYWQVVQYYYGLLGPSTSRYARLAGECVVWEKIDIRFEVCRSSEAGEHGHIIAHVWPVRPIDT